MKADVKRPSRHAHRFSDWRASFPVLRRPVVREVGR